MEKSQKEIKKCLVTGATGVVGIPLVRELVRSGHRVTILARGEAAERMFSPEVEIVRGDLTNPNALENSAQNAEWIFHLAAKLHISNPDESLRREYEETNVRATENLLKYARANNAEKFVFFSTINVYGASDKNEIFDESSRLNPIGFYGESKAAAEKAVLSARNERGKQFGVVLRLAAVYGSRMKGNYIRLLEAVRRNRFFFIGDGSNRRTLVHQSDAARAAVLAAEKAAGGSIYNVTDGEIHTLKEIVAAISQSLEKNKPKIQIPIAAVRAGVGAAETFGNLIGVKTPVNRALLEKFLEDAAVRGDKIQRELGFRPEFDLHSGWRETVSNLRLQIAE